MRKEFRPKEGFVSVDCSQLTIALLQTVYVRRFLLRVLISVAYLGHRVWHLVKSLDRWDSGKETINCCSIGVQGKVKHMLFTRDNRTAKQRKVHEKFTTPFQRMKRIRRSQA